MQAKKDISYKEELAERIMQIAKEVGGGNELARKIGRSRTTLENYMKGVSEAPASVLIDIANTTGHNIEWLMTGEQFMVDYDENLDPIITDPEVVKIAAKSPKITAKIVEDAVRNLMEYLLEHEKTLEPTSISKAAALLCEMGSSEGTVTRETVERLMTFRN